MLTSHEKGVLRIDDVEFRHGKSGTMIRCTVSVGPNSDVVWSTSGCLILREEDGALRLMPPVVKWKTPSGKVINLRPNKPSPLLVEKLLAKVEQVYGASIQQDKVRSKLQPSRVEPDLPDDLEVE